jgi:amidase
VRPTSRSNWQSLPDLAQTSRIYRELLSAVFAVDLTLEMRERVEAAASALSPDDQSLAASGLRGQVMSHAEWVQKSRMRAGLHARWPALFQEVDIVLCPPMPTVAFPHDHSLRYARKLDIDGAQVPYFDRVCGPASLR